MELKVVKKLKEVAFYPCIVLTFSLLILTFLMVFVFPNFIKIFEDSKTELPLLTKILIYVSENFYIIIFLIICILTVIIFCLKNIKNAQKFIAGDGKVAWLLNSLRLLYNHKLQKGR